MHSFVADSNILFTFFWEGSALSGVMEQGAKIYAPAFFLEELRKHQDEITRKAGLDKSGFQTKKRELEVKIEIVGQKEYSSQLKAFEMHLENLPEDIAREIIEDEDFAALAIRQKCPLWSNDRLLKKQKLVPVLDTREIIELLG